MCPPFSRTSPLDVDIKGFESLNFHVSPGNTTSNQALASGTNNTSLAKRMEIDANGTVTIGGDLFNDSGARATVPVTITKTST